MAEAHNHDENSNSVEPEKTLDDVALIVAENPHLFASNRSRLKRKRGQKHGPSANGG